MSVRTSATRYAKALLDVALQESDATQIERDLTSIVTAMEQTADLRRALTSHGVPVTVRANVIRAIAEKVGAASPLVKLLNMLAEKGRLELLPVLLDVYRERLLAHGNTVRAQVTSATPLTPDNTRGLEQSLAKLTGKHVQIETSVDPSLIGGVVAKIGSTVYDGSVRTQLEKVREQLIENA
ncbi:MAG TPA: ATP synthase F1 subunit delta [Vicinamibacterales bacterium]|nr:ATP synthase F1 subunit delta [Vicinamibacterales bacterium]